MHRLDLNQIKQDGHIDLSTLIGTKTIYNALPRRARDAVDYLTKFAGRTFTGTVLHNDQYKDVFKTWQDLLSRTKLTSSNATDPQIPEGSVPYGSTEGISSNNEVSPII